MEQDLVLMLSASGANDALAGLIQDYGNALGDAGAPVVHVSLQQQEELKYAVDLMRQRKVRFAVTWLGVGQDLTVTIGETGATANIFEYLGVPLIKLQGDLPAYYVDFHRDIPQNSANLYQADEFVSFRKRWLPAAQSITGLIPPIPMVPTDISNVDIAARKKGSLFFLKNGNSPTELKAMWQRCLPDTVARTALGMARELDDTPMEAPLFVGTFVAEYLQREGIEVATPKLIWFYAAQMDDYLRRVKSTMIAEAILDFPVYVQGSFWDHVDFNGRRARRLPGTTVFDSQQIVQRELGVIDMSANVDSWPHDRVQRAAGSYSLVLTNEQRWLSEQFPAFRDLAFQFEATSIAERISDVLTHRDRYLELAMEFGKRFREVFPRERFAERVLTMADHVRVLSERPALQNYFVWTRH